MLSQGIPPIERGVELDVFSPKPEKKEGGVAERATDAAEGVGVVASSSSPPTITPVSSDRMALSESLVDVTTRLGRFRENAKELAHYAIRQLIRAGKSVGTAVAHLGKRKISRVSPPAQREALEVKEVASEVKAAVDDLAKIVESGKKEGISILRSKIATLLAFAQSIPTCGTVSKDGSSVLSVFNETTGMFSLRTINEEDPRPILQDGEKLLTPKELTLEIQKLINDLSGYSAEDIPMTDRENLSKALSTLRDSQWVSDGEKKPQFEQLIVQARLATEKLKLGTEKKRV